VLGHLQVISSFTINNNNKEKTRMRYEGNGENYIMRSLMICTPHPIPF
jgi:hypothetical protein